MATLSELISCRVHSVVDGLFDPLYRLIPNVGKALPMDIDIANPCAGDCKYCTNGLKLDGKGLKTETIDSNKIVDALIALNRIKPDVVEFGEKIELGLYPKALKRAAGFRKGLNDNIIVTYTTKLPGVVAGMFKDNDNVVILVTLTNPLNIEGLEGKAIPSYKERLRQMREIASKYNVNLGVRIVIMKKEEIPIFKRDLRGLLRDNIVDHNFCYIGFLRAGKHKKKGALNEAVGDLLGAHFPWYTKHGETVTFDVLKEGVDTFTKMGMTFDRLPSGIEVNFGRPIKQIVTNRFNCYLMPDRPCIRGTCDSESRKCRGHLVCTGEKLQRIMTGSKKVEGIFCKQIADMTEEDMLKYQPYWLNLALNDRYAAGVYKRKDANIISVLKIFWNSEFTKKFGLRKRRVVRSKKGRVYDLTQPWHTSKAKGGDI